MAKLQAGFLRGHCSGIWEVDDASDGKTCLIAARSTHAASG